MIIQETLLGHKLGLGNLCASGCISLRCYGKTRFSQNGAYSSKYLCEGSLSKHYICLSVIRQSNFKNKYRKAVPGEVLQKWQFGQPVLSFVSGHD